MTNSFVELENARCLLVVGSNTSEAHPIAAKRLFRALDNGSKLIVVDPRKTQIAQMAHLHVRPNLGTDVALINGMMHVIYKNGWHNQAFIEERTENFEELIRIIEQFPPERTAQITGVAAADIVEMGTGMRDRKPVRLSTCWVSHNTVRAPIMSRVLPIWPCCAAILVGPPQESIPSEDRTMFKEHVTWVPYLMSCLATNI